MVRYFQSLIFSGISLNIHKYHRHPKFISYLANIARMLNYFTLILYICHGCYSWSRVLQAISPPADGWRPAGRGGLGATHTGVTFIPFLLWAGSTRRDRGVVLALFCTPTSWGR